MRNLLLLLALLMAAVSARADLVTATIVITNAPTVNGATLTVNGNTRTWTNNVVNAATQIGTNATIGGSATNMFNQIAGAPFAGVSLARGGTNGVVLAGIDMTATVSAGYATVTLVTNPISAGRTVLVPFASAYNATSRVGIASLLITGLENTTTAFETNSPALTNHFGRFTDQTISGSNWFTGANMFSNVNQFITGGGISNMALTNITYFQGSNGIIWALFLVNPTLTNGLNYGNPFRSPGSAANSEQFGTSASATGIGSLAVGNSATASGSQDVAIGQATIASGGTSVALGTGATGSGNESTAVGANSQASGATSTALGGDAIAGHDNSTAIGQFAATTAANQIRLGTASEHISIPGNMQVEGNQTNNHWIGTNILDGAIQFLRKNNTSLANGANAAVDVSTNTFVKLSGPSGAFTLNGIAGGRDGRLIVLQNSTGFTLTIANDSGVEPVAANRILCGTGADITQANNPGTAVLIYDSAVSRWVVVSKN